MASNYLEFSEEICKLTPDEVTWLKKRYERGPRHPDHPDFDAYDFEIGFVPHLEVVAGLRRRNGTDACTWHHCHGLATRRCQHCRSSWVWIRRDFTHAGQPHQPLQARCGDSAQAKEARLLLGSN